MRRRPLRARAHAQKIGELENRVADLGAEQDKLNAAQAVLGKKEADLSAAIAQALSDIRDLEAEEKDVEIRISVLDNAKTTDFDKNSSALQEMDGYRKISETLGGQCKSKEETVAKYDVELASIDGEIADAETKAGRIAVLVRAAEKDCNDAKFRQDSLAQRIATIRSMEEHFEGYSGAVRYVMKQYDEGKITDTHGAPCGKIYGPLSKVISVEDRYVTAIEIALGANLQNIVVEDEATAKAAMYALKRGEAGRATFFPLTSMKASQPTREMTEAAVTAATSALPTVWFPATENSATCCPLCSAERWSLTTLTTPM